jgi:hypothetical protein
MSDLRTPRKAGIPSAGLDAHCLPAAGAVPSKLDLPAAAGLAGGRSDPGSEPRGGLEDFPAGRA